VLYVVFVASGYRVCLQSISKQNIPMYYHVYVCVCVCVVVIIRDRSSQYDIQYYYILLICVTRGTESFVENADLKSAVRSFRMFGRRISVFICIKSYTGRLKTLLLQTKYAFSLYSLCVMNSIVIIRCCIPITEYHEFNSKPQRRVLII